ncbi:MAG: NMD3-related protein, partial [Candidatus Aenigmarchaeota archaeon]|nr:NMD3-related protein [Candidatus Aenigmarchaeota archaeon]MDI6722824.1 NMD3-related protein [Candidatus Aenigmarchaeota archaeon]
MFCIKCGGEAVKDNLCRKCFLGMNDLFEASGSIVCFCDMCNSYHSKNKKSDIDSLIKNMIKSSNKISNIEIRKREIGNRLTAEIICTGKISGIEKKEAKKALIIVKK